MEITPDLREKIESALDIAAEKVARKGKGNEDSSEIWKTDFHCLFCYLIGAWRLLKEKGWEGYSNEIKDIALSSDFLRGRIVARMTHKLERLRKEDEGVYEIYLKNIEELPNHISKDFSFLDLEAAISGESTGNSLSPVPIYKGQTQKAQELIVDTTKISKSLFDTSKDMYSNDSHLTTAKKRGKPIITVVSVDYEEMRIKGVDIPAWDRLRPFDREVLSVATSLYKAGNEVMTPQMIYQALSGNKEKTDLPPVMRERIIRSLRILRGVQITIDSGAELAASLNKKAKFEGALLPSKRIEVAELNGQIVIDSIQILSSSPLYDYAEGKGQISRIDIKMLNAPINNTETNIELKGYLARHIKSAKNEKSNIGPVIRYDTLYEYLRIEEGIQKGNKQSLKDKKQDIRKAVRAILDYWTKEGEIEGYTEEKEGREIAKINLILKSNKVKKSHNK